MSKYKAQPLDIVMAVEELAMDGAINLGRCCKRTAQKDTARINQYLKENKYDWHVKLVIDNAPTPWPYSVYVCE